MKVLVIGGTGLVGSYLLPGLIEKRYEVFALTRSEDKIEGINRLGAHGITGDIRKPESFRSSLPEQLDIIVLLAMPGVKPGKRMTKKRKQELRYETKAFFKNSMDLGRAYSVPVILPSGTSFRTEKDEVADETWPILRKGITEIGADTDEMFFLAKESQDPPVVQLLYGKIYGNGGLFRFIFDMMAKGRSRILGKGDNFIPNIHAADAASALIKAIEKLPLGERIIIADDTPVTQAEFTNYMADLMGKKRPGHLPAFIIRLVLGKDFCELIRINCRVSNEKAKKLLDWKPEYPSYKEGLAVTIKEMMERKS